MATESPVRLLSSGGMRGGMGPLSDGLRSTGATGHTTSPTRDGVAQELGLLFKSRSRFENVFSGRDVPQRSGSAPPSVEGSLAAMGGLFGHQPTSPKSATRVARAAAEGSDFEAEQELRSDPTYLAYYYSHINLNPRLPPPLISRENWRLAQRLQSGVALGGIGDKRKLRSLDDSNSKSLFSSQPVLPTHREEPEPLEDENSPLEELTRQSSVEWLERGGDPYASMGLGARPKSLVDLIQEDFPRTPSPVYNHSRSSSRAANEEGGEGGGAMEGQLTHMREPSITASELQAAGLGSRSTTPIPAALHLLAGSNASVTSSAHAAPLPIDSPGGSRSVSPALPMMGVGVGLESRQASLNAAGAAELAAALQGFSLADAQGAAEEREQLHQHQLQHQELREQQQQQQLRLQQQQQQQQQQHRQQRQLAHAQAQAAHTQAQAQLAYGQALQQQQQQLQQQQQQQQQQQLYSGLDPSAFRAQAAKFGLPSQQANPASLQPALPAGAVAPMYAAAAAAMSYMAGSQYFQGMHYGPQYGVGGYPMNPALLAPMMAGYPAPGTLPVGFDGAAAAAAVAATMGVRGAVPGSPAQSAVDVQNLYKFVGQAGTGLPPPIPDPIYLHQYVRAAEEARAAAALSDPTLRGYMGGHIDMLELQKGQLNAMLGYTQEPKSQYSRGGAIGLPIATKSGSVSPAYYGSPPNVGLVMPYANSPMASPVLPGSPVGPASLSLRRDDRTIRLPSGASRISSSGATSYPGWQNHSRTEAADEIRGSTLLEEFKNSKTRRFELSDIAGHVVEFSADQHGSRFIQQKLETASPEEKSMVFQEVLPRALTLMTDVFGNYVIQKFFEHGTPQQRRELASQLLGHVLTLSLQMYGCRVIQKALEVVDVDQQTQLVAELDGHVMRCVRDQNGNHVIQKCIECVPPDRIHFIIAAFYGQVLVLSMHPYGCRVIQRVLERCTDDQKQRGIMEEILRSTCNLAQDQYGNYVVQHVLEHGRSHERSDIITKLAGQIVQMSQHKFASNVVEKCLEFGGPAERQILINEMLGHTDENEPLQAMMKDQFANYVVQKVLETCDDQQREMLLSRIRVHLHALKKYTYGKHIVARVEKLVAAGERRSATAAYNNSLAHMAAAASS